MPGSDGAGLRLRRMTPRDVAAGLHLCRLSSWNQLEADWRCFLDSETGGGWLAEIDGRVAGTVAWLGYGRSFTWLSMMLVDPALRHTGIGTKLLEAALDTLQDDECVRLDATPAGEPLYRRHGFVPEYALVRGWFRSPAIGVSLGSSRRMAPEDLPQVFSRDAEIFGADRSQVLSWFYTRAPELAWISRDETAYCFGRPGYRCAQLGPIVAEHLFAACDLMSHCLASRPGRGIIVDVPRELAEWIGWLESIGFEIERSFLRMRRGANPHPGCPDRQLAIAGPEFG